jgi:hypothetical protein
VVEIEPTRCAVQGWITKVTLGYGYQPWRALLFLVVKDVHRYRPNSSSSSHNMVLAAARTLARRRMGACETTPPATHREPAHNPDKPTATDPFPAPEDRQPPAGVKLVRPRRCAAAGAPAAIPWPRGEKTRAAARKDPEE